MNRKNKLILTGILAIIYLVIALNFHKIKFAFSMFRLYSGEKKIESVDDNKSSTIKPIVDNPLESILSKVDNVGNSDEVVYGDDITVDKSGDKGDTSKRSYESIIIEYNTQLEDLRGTFESQLDDLVAQGIKEYKKGDLSTSQLASRYLSTGAKLEKVSDGEFNSVIKDMEKDLKTNGHGTEIIKEVKNYYTEFKDSKKTDLINRGMKHVD